MIDVLAELERSLISERTIGQKFMAETLFYEYFGPFFVPARLQGYRGRVGNLDVIEHRRRDEVPTLRAKNGVTKSRQKSKLDITTLKRGN